MSARRAGSGRTTGPTRLGGSRYSATILADQPLAYWRLGESSGTTMSDSSGYSHNGTYVGSPTLGTTGLISGDANTGVTFAIGKYAEVASNAWMTNSSRFTAEAVVKPTGVTGTQEIFVWQDANAAGRFYLQLDGSKVSFSVRANNQVWQGPIQSATGSAVAGKRLHVAATFEDGNAKLYVGGALAASTTGWSLLVSPTAKMGVGGDSFDSSSSSFVGVVDEVAFYGIALSAERIAAHAALI